MRRAIVILCILTLPQPCSYAATLLVRPDGRGDHPTIQAAIDAAAEGDTVLLSDGRYTGEGNYEVVFPDWRLLVSSVDNDPRGCVIDCQSLGRAFVIRGAGAGPSWPSYPFHTDSMTTRVGWFETVIRGIAITGGLSDLGGAVLCGKHSKPTFDNCVFWGNRATEKGGALHFRQSGATLVNCLIFDNSAAEAGGGASLCCCAVPTLVSCTVARNSAPEGSGIFFSPSSRPTLEYTVVAFCGPGAGISTPDEQHSFCQVEATWCNVFGNQGGDLIPCHVDSVPGGSILCINPLFRDLGAGDFRLLPESICSGANNPRGKTIGAYDVDWVP